MTCSFAEKSNQEIRNNGKNKDIWILYAIRYIYIQKVGKLYRIEKG